VWSLHINRMEKDNKNWRSNCYLQEYPRWSIFSR